MIRKQINDNTQWKIQPLMATLPKMTGLSNYIVGQGQRFRWNQQSQLSLSVLFWMCISNPARNECRTPGGQVAQATGFCTVKPTINAFLVTLRAGRSGDRNLVRARFSRPNLPPWGPPSLTMQWASSLSRGQTGRREALATHPQHALRLNKE